MSSFEEIDAATIDGLGKEIDSWGLSFTDNDLLATLRHGDEVRLNAFAGNDLRQGLITAYGHARAAYNADTERLSANRTESKYVAWCLYLELRKQVGGSMTRALALEGEDYVGLGQGAGELGALRLKKDQRLFGRLEGVNVEEFVTISPGGERRSIGFQEGVEPIHLWGGTVILKDVEVCERGGYGSVISTFTEVSVPVHPNGLEWLLTEHSAA